MDDSITRVASRTSHLSGRGRFHAFAREPTSTRASIFQSLLATALFRCWHILLFYTIWATAVVLINRYVAKFQIEATLLAVTGNVLGFVISYRTVSSFERYNEGRRLWSQIIWGSRNFARLVWFHVPDMNPPLPNEKLTDEERKARVLVEKKTVINLIEAFAVSIKHYLRGEDGIYYTDLYYLVKYLPAYALPTGIPPGDAAFPDASSEVGSPPESPIRPVPRPSLQQSLVQRPLAASAEQLPLPAVAKAKTSFAEPLKSQATSRPKHNLNEKGVSGDEAFLLPANMPPRWYIFDLFPFSLLVKLLTKKGKEIKGQKAARLRAKLRGTVVSHNLPLEISLYLSTYVASLQSRKVIDPPTATNFLLVLNSLVDALTGLERILTTPIPYSYSMHLWLVTVVYCLILPPQILKPMGWLTIPATTLVSFIFFGFLVAGEEIENPFGYDKNDLNMDHFTHNIIRNELRAITGTPTPDPARWAFSPENDVVFAVGPPGQEERIAPEDWLKKGHSSIQYALAAAAATYAT